MIAKVLVLYILYWLLLVCHLLGKRLFVPLILGLSQRKKVLFKRLLALPQEEVCS